MLHSETSTTTENVTWKTFRKDESLSHRLNFRILTTQCPAKDEARLFLRSLLPVCGLSKVEGVVLTLGQNLQVDFVQGTEEAGVILYQMYQRILELRLVEDEGRLSRLLRCASSERRRGACLPFRVGSPGSCMLENAGGQQD